MSHKEWDLLSAYIDGELAPDEHAVVQAHLASCSDCAKEAHDLTLMQTFAAAAPFHTMPPSLLAKLEDELSKPTWMERLHLLRAPHVAVPIGATAALAMGLMLWTSGPGRDEIPLEPLMAAHMRCSAEGLIPHQDLSHPEFMAYLVAENAQ